uniref:Uncharacterized protein n=1 Tax=Romanomermis culicivorax TaxID=13658 RepID=A0A915K7G1_ROMCU
MNFCSNITGRVSHTIPGARDPHKTSPSTDVLRQKIRNVFCPSSSNAAVAPAAHNNQSSQNVDRSVNNCNSRPMPRSSYSYGGEMATAQSKSAHVSLIQKNRRTSLPAGPLAPAKISSS